MPERIDTPLGYSRAAGPAARTVKKELSVSAAMLLFEAMTVFMVFFKTGSMRMLPLGIYMIGIILAGCLIMYFIGADLLLYVAGTMLMNFGFMTQFFSTAGEMSSDMTALLLKLTAAVGIFLAVLILMCLKKTIVMHISLILLLQIALVIVLFVMKDQTTSDYGQAALVNIPIGKNFSIQPFEIIKVSYVFVLTYILCLPAEEDLRLFIIARIPGRMKKWAVLAYTVLVMLIMARCGELGSAVMIFAVCAGMLTIFYPDRRFVAGLWIFTLAAGTAVWLIVAHHAGPLLETIKSAESANIQELGGLDKLFIKIYLRFTTFLHPEDHLYLLPSLGNLVPGIHGVSINEALTTGGWWGPLSNLYIVNLGEQTNDMVFTKLVQCMGVPFGLLLIGLYVYFLYLAAQTGAREKSVYWKAVCTGFLILIGIEAVYNIGSASGLLPIMGIPLYLVSQGFTSLSMGLTMLAVLLVVSKGSFNRRKIRNGITRNQGTPTHNETDGPQRLG